MNFPIDEFNNEFIVSYLLSPNKSSEAHKQISDITIMLIMPVIL